MLNNIGLQFFAVEPGVSVKPDVTTNSTMAINIQMNIKQSDGSYNILYPQTTAGQIASGTLDSARIPSLAASKITSGTFDAARIPSMDASKITAGTFGSTDNSTGYVFPSNVRIKNGSNYGMKLNFGDGDYVYLYEDSDDNLTIKAKRIELTTTASPGVTNNGSALGGSSVSYPITVANGGTGGTSASAAVYNLTQPLSTRSAANVNSYASSTYIPCYYSTTGYKFPVSNLLTYIQNNISSSNTGLKFLSGSRSGNGSTSYSISLSTSMTPILFDCSAWETSSYPVYTSTSASSYQSRYKFDEDGLEDGGLFVDWTGKGNTASVTGFFSTSKATLKTVNITRSSSSISVSASGSSTKAGDIANASSTTYYWWAIGY